MSDGAIRGFIDEAALVLSPLLDVESPDDVVRLLAKLGWTVASVPAPIADLTTAGADLLAALDGGDDATTTEELLAAIAKIVDAIEAIRARPDNAFPGTVDVASFKATIGRDLLDNHQRPVAAVVGFGVFAGLVYLIQNAFPLGQAQHFQTFQATTGIIGNAIFRSYVLPFEAISFLLLAALIGAIVLARKDETP